MVNVVVVSKLSMFLEQEGLSQRGCSEFISPTVFQESRLKLGGHLSFHGAHAPDSEYEKNLISGDFYLYLYLNYYIFDC